MRIVFTIERHSLQVTGSLLFAGNSLEKSPKLRVWMRFFLVKLSGENCSENRFCPSLASPQRVKSLPSQSPKWTILTTLTSPFRDEITFKFEPTPIVQSVFDKFESLPEGSTVLLSYDFDPAMAPEVQPMANVLTRHAFERGHKIIFMCLFATGEGQFNVTDREVIKTEFADRVNGVEF